jgi:SAM-dependent methyltransferase
MPLLKRLRGSLEFLVDTPFHPQWLAGRLRRRRNAWLAVRAKGHALDVGCADRSVGTVLGSLESYLGMDYPDTANTLYGTRPDVYGDASRLPFADGAFDCVLLLDVLEHIDMPEAAMAETSRVLRPGGELLLTIPFAYPLHDLPHDFQRFTRVGLWRRLDAAGLRVEELEEAGGGIGAAALSVNLTLAYGIFRALAARRFAGVVALPLLLAIPFINLSGALLSWLLPVPDFLPGAYFVRATRR